MKVHQNHLENLLKQIACPLKFLIQQVQKKKMLLNTLEHVLPGPSWEQWGLEHPNTSHEDICNYWRSEGKF